MSEQNTTVSIQLSDMTLDELEQLSQGLGHQLEKIREQRAYVRKKIDERLARGERNGGVIDAAVAARAAVEAAKGDGVAPGAVIDASAS